MLPSVDKLHGHADFLLQQDLALANSAKITTDIFVRHNTMANVLDCPATRLT